MTVVTVMTIVSTPFPLRLGGGGHGLLTGPATATGGGFEPPVRCLMHAGWFRP